MKKNRLIKIGTGIFLFVSCIFGVQAQPQSSDITNISEHKINENPVKVQIGEDNGAALHNPLMGWQYSNFPENIVQAGIPEAFDVGVIWCSWDRLEPTKNGYDFTLLDQAINRLRKDGKTVFLRLYLMPDNVWKIAGYPEWIKQEPGIGTFKPVHFDNINGNGPYDFEHPDYSNSVWQGLVSKFLKQVADHYRDGDVDVIDSRAYGLYGEWDSNWGNYWNKNDPAYPANKTKVLNKIVDIYKDAFKDYRMTKISINVSSESFATVAEARTYLRQAALDNALGAGFAIRFDGIGDSFDPSRHVMQTVVNDYFPASPVFCETWYGWDTSKYSVDGTNNSFLKVRSNAVNYSFTKQWEYQRALEYNPNFFTSLLKPNADDEQIGYRILPVNIEYSKDGVGKIRLSSRWKNKGVGVLYRHYPLKLSLLAASGQEVFSKICDDFNITRLVKGEIYDYSTTLDLAAVKPGEYKLQIALVDKNNGNRSAIRMPIGNADNQTADYVIGTVIVNPN